MTTDHLRIRAIFDSDEPHDHTPLCWVIERVTTSIILVKLTEGAAVDAFERLNAL